MHPVCKDSAAHRDDQKHSYEWATRTAEAALLAGRRIGGGIADDDDSSPTNRFLLSAACSRRRGAELAPVAAVFFDD